MNSLYHYNKLRTELTALQRRRDQRLEDLVRLKRKARECGERHIGRKLTNAHVLSFFEEFRNETKEGGKWQFIREERSALFTRFGHTKTFVYIITLLQERAVQKYAKSRERHGEINLVADAIRLENILTYNQRRYNPIDYCVHLHSRMAYASQIQTAQDKVLDGQDNDQQSGLISPT